MLSENKPQTSKVFVVHNPVAGTSDPELVRSEIENHLNSSGKKYQIHETSKQDNVREIVNDALQQGFQMFWAAGGDGTVAAVVNGLVNKNIPMGIIPIGTGNALARELDIPLDVAAACDLLVGAHKTRVLDVLKVGEEHFVLSVSTGISAYTMVETAREQKRRLGQFAYLLNGMRLIVVKSIWPFNVSIDGQEFVIRASEVVAANAGIIGYKPIRWGEQVQLDDGKVNLCHVEVDSLAKLLSVLMNMLLHRQERLREVTCRPAKSFIEIKSRRPIPVQGDGEDIGHTPVRIEVIAKSVPVIVPEEETN